MISASRSWPPIAILAALLVTGGALAGVPPVSMSLSMPRLAAPGLRAALERSPDDPDLHVRLGIAMAKLGYFGDALACFQFSLGSTEYERLGLLYHADTLSTLGRHAEAAQLRREELALHQSPLAELLTRVGLVDDLRSMGDPSLDREVWALIAAFPDGATAWATLAETHMDRGELEEAATALALPTPPRVSARVWQARARLAALEGDPIGAEALLLEGLEQNRSAEAIVEDLAELRLSEGDPWGALDLLEMPRFGEPERPRWLAAEARALAATGASEAACERLGRLRAVYPSDPTRLEPCGLP